MNRTQYQHHNSNNGDHLEKMFRKDFSECFYFNWNLENK